MSRVVKFRSWDKSKNIFIPTHTWAVFSDDSNSDAFGIMINDWENYREGEFFYSNSQELSQFTGLLDREGKDIYEGDVVKYTLRDDSEKNQIESAVEWHRHAWRLSKLWLLTEIDSIEVIGNIYEQIKTHNNE